MPFSDFPNVRAPPNEDEEAILETSAPQIIADLKVSSVLTTSPGNLTNEDGSRAVVTKPTPIGESLKTVTKQLLQSPSATDMAVTDVRTPPKIKNQLLAQDIITLGKGEAVPVIMEDENHNNYEKLTSSQSHVSIGTFSKRPIEDSTPQSGLSTWILLNNDNMHHITNGHNTPMDDNTLKMTSKLDNPKPVLTSPATFQENKTPQKKKHKPGLPTPIHSSTESFIMNTKPKEELTASIKKLEKKPLTNSSVKTGQTTTPFPEYFTEKLEELVAEIDPATGEKKPSITLQDSKFKNKTPVIVGRIPQKDKIEATVITTRMPTKIVAASSTPVTKAVPDNITRFGTPVVTFPHVPPRVRPSAQQKEEEKLQQTKFQLQKQQQQKLQIQYQQKLQQQKIQQQLREQQQQQQQQTKQPSTTTALPLFSPTPTPTSAPKPEVGISTTVNSTETTMLDYTTVTDTPTVATIKKVKRPTQKKKKKNKTRRRRPSKTPNTKTGLESKVSEDSNPAAKIPGIQNKPLSTRIYNYLAREVVPNVGVGLVGLMLTAGLAGLLLYPFGGGIAARRTEKFSGNAPASHNYYYNEYSTTSDLDHGQAEEQVFGQVLAGMSHSDPQYTSAYSRERPSNNFYNSNSKYKPARFETADDYGQSSMVGFKEDLTQEVKYSTLGDANKDYNAEISSKYSSSGNINGQNTDGYGISDPESDNSNVNKYIDPTSTSDIKSQQFSPVAGSTSEVKPNTKYSSTIDSSYTAYSGQVGHGTVYNDDVGYGDTMESEHKNHRIDYQAQEENISVEKMKPMENSDEIITAEDNKSSSSLTQQTNSKEEQPTYSALEGIPKRINYNSYSYENHNPSDEAYSESFVPMNVNEQDSFSHRYSLQVEHGPRNLKLPEELKQKPETTPKVRRKRQLYKKAKKDDDEMENEIDGIFIDDSMSTGTLPTRITTLKRHSSPSKSDIFAPTTPENIVDAWVTKPEDDSKKDTHPTSKTHTADAVEVISIESEDLQTSNILSTEQATKSDKTTKFDSATTEKPVIENEHHKPQFSLMDVLKKVAEFKINLGLNILKTTSETLSRYLGNIQSKMMAAMRQINRFDKEIRKEEKINAQFKDDDKGKKETSSSNKKYITVSKTSNNDDTDLHNTDDMSITVKDYTDRGNTVSSSSISSTRSYDISNETRSSISSSINNNINTNNNNNNSNNNNIRTANNNFSSTHDDGEIIIDHGDDTNGDFNYNTETNRNIIRRRMKRQSVFKRNAP